MECSASLTGWDHEEGKKGDKIRKEGAMGPRVLYDGRGHNIFYCFSRERDGGSIYCAAGTSMKKATS